MTSATRRRFRAIDAMMTRHVLSSALFAGLVAGLVAVALQFVFVTPLLLEGELYESGARTHFAGAPEAHAGPAPEAQETAETANPDSSGPDDGHHADPASAGGLDLRRHGLTVAFNLVAYTGFGLVLAAGLALAERSGRRVTPRKGLLWGLSGFLAVHLAPAIGLPPELPGSGAAALEARQIWWIATVLCTGAGLALIAFGSGIVHWVAAIVAVAVPHVVGAPHPEGYSGLAPPGLSALFATRSLGVAAASWAALGLSLAFFWNRRSDSLTARRTTAQPEQWEGP